MREILKPLVICAPLPRSLDLIFTKEAETKFRAAYRVLESDDAGVVDLSPEILSEARYIIGQPPLTAQTWPGVFSRSQDPGPRSI